MNEDIDALLQLHHEAQETRRMLDAAATESVSPSPSATGDVPTENSAPASGGLAARRKGERRARRRGGVNRTVQSANVLWRAERFVSRSELQLTIRKTLIGAAAGVVVLFALQMLDQWIFIVTAPRWGEATAALVLTGANLLIAAALAMWARSLKPSEDIATARGVRDAALADIERDVAEVDKELDALSHEIDDFVHHPVEALLPDAIAPSLRRAAEKMTSRASTSRPEAETATSTSSSLDGSRAPKTARGWMKKLLGRS